MTNELHSEIPRLPATVTELVRNRPMARTLNDMVEELHLRTYNNEEYQRLLTAVYDSQALTGKIILDEGKAAQYLIRVAEQLDSPVRHEKEWTIVKSLRRVLKHYNIGRSQRRDMVGDKNAANGSMAGIAAE